MKTSSYLLAGIGLSLMVSCVTQRKFAEEENKRKACETELSALKTNFQADEEKIRQLSEELAKDIKDIQTLQKDTNLLGASYRQLVQKYDKLNALNEQISERYSKLLSGSENEKTKLIGDLQQTKEELLKKQDELRLLETELKKQRNDLDALSIELKKRETRVNELEDVLRKKDQAVLDLKKKLSDALYNFENKGLTITHKNGKVYVSMDESLLFASGKTAVEPKGIEALKNLAKVLEQNADINVMVEGHTDDVPMKGSGDIKDNWDLSVMRATSVTKIILQSGPGIDPKRIVASGRGEFFPLDGTKTPEARKKNRRTEIILTPKLDELFKVLEN